MTTGMTSSICWWRPICAFLAAALPLAGRANVLGTDMQNFNATTSGLDFVTVHSSETLRPGIINLGLFFNYAVNTLPYFDSLNTQSRTNFNDTVLGADLNAGIGLMRNWDVGISFPQILTQSVRDQNGPRGEFTQTGSAEVRLNTKYRLLGDDSGGVAAIASVGINRIENNPWVGSGGGPTVNLEMAADTTIDRIALGANVGYRIRNPGTPLVFSQVQPLKDQIIASGAVSYHMPDWNTKFIGEVFASFPSQQTTSNADRTLSSLEALAGAKHDLTQNLALHAGGGAGIIKGVASPDWRVYTGLNYTFGPLWGANDLNEQEVPTNRHLVKIIPPEPKPLPETLVERFRTQHIHFAFDSDEMLGTYAAVLVELVEHLGKGFKQLVIEGHTDSIGSVSYNDRLSLQRANAIKIYLQKKYKLEPQKIATIGYGPRRPVGDNGNYQGRQRNRRVEFEIKR
jgi:outer membrane protein OmpA-like peptidoglycan-associated protein